MTALPSTDDIKAMRGSAVLALCLEILRDEADRIRQSQEALIAGHFIVGWDDSRARAHHGLSAVAEVVDRWLTDAKRAEGAKKPHSLILDSADIARSALIVGVTATTAPVPIPAPEADDAAA